MKQIDEVIREYDTDGVIKKSICEAISKNMTNELAIESLASDLQVRLYGYIFASDALSIDDGTNVERDFREAIKEILKEYFKA
jgi:hypothetical protein